MGGSPEVLTGDFYVGYRSWPVQEHGVLMSANRHYEWPVGDIQATCNPPGQLASSVKTEPHMVPASSCQCGIYAYYHVNAPAVRYGEIMGVILVWGDICLHKERMRAQFARIAGILIPSEFERPAEGDTGDHNKLLTQQWDLIHAAKDRYKVPLVEGSRPSDVEEIVTQEFGKHVPESLLPDSEQDSIRQRLAGDGGE